MILDLYPFYLGLKRKKKNPQGNSHVYVTYFPLQNVDQVWKLPLSHSPWSSPQHLTYKCSAYMGQALDYEVICVEQKVLNQENLGSSSGSDTVEPIWAFIASN